MSKPSARSTLYRLIEAGQLAHKALLVPLLERGLEPGDDAVLFVLGRSGTTEAELAAELGLEGAALEARLARLTERELIARQAVGPQLQPGLALTERGERIKSVLAGNWEELENALLGELKKKQRKRLGAVLQRFVELLRL
jgi:DNA-binding MarR family transcriptional regulator